MKCFFLFLGTAAQGVLFGCRPYPGAMATHVWNMQAVDLIKEQCLGVGFHCVVRE
jgi:hypothetical protein